MSKPVRLQLSRRKGFNLQELSRATNGLEAVKVDRSTNFGNPYARKAIGQVSNELLVGLFRDLMRSSEPSFAKSNVRQLRGFNLACWCKPGDPCHADVLLEIANSTNPHPEGE